MGVASRVADPIRNRAAAKAGSKRPLSSSMSTAIASGLAFTRSALIAM